DNVFLTRDGVVKILDFGLARQSAAAHANDRTLTEVSEAGVVVGTAGYMSPGQIRGQPVDHRSDVFSLGCVLYAMLGRRRAFTGATSAETMAAILKEEPPDLATSDPALSAPLDRLVRHCLEKSPENRFQSAADVAFDLAGLAGASASASATA